MPLAPSWRTILPIALLGAVTAISLEDAISRRSSAGDDVSFPSGGDVVESILPAHPTWREEQESLVSPYIATGWIELRPESVRDFERMLDSMSADGQPRKFLVGQLPDDLGDVVDIERKKELFVKAVLPAVRVVNDEIMAIRARVKAALEHGKDEAYVDDLARSYGLKDVSDGEGILARIDIVPASLVLAQAAIESGWGTSRFAREGNALFGQRTWNEEGEGIEPSEARSGGFKVKSFSSIEDSVRAYVFNLNSHPAYAAFRKIRLQARRRGEPISSYALAQALLRYSEKGPAYVQTVRSVMKDNDLADFDRPLLDVRSVDSVAVERRSAGRS